MASSTLTFPVNKRLILPATFAFTVPLSGDDFVDLPFKFAGVITYIAITGPAGNPKGKIRIINDDTGNDVHKDPKPSRPDVLLDFYTFEMRLPVNGNYRFRFEDLSDGAYKGEIIFELRERRV